jgi:hypothetical protein
MNGGLIALFVVAAIAAVAIQWWLKQKRRDELGAVAKRLGLRFSEEDTSDTLSLPFALFTAGDGRGTENLLEGTWEELPLREFDYWYYVESTDAQGHRTKSYKRFSCAVTEIADVAFPHLSIAQENLFTRLADGIGLDDIAFELAEFNDEFNVKSRDRKFANDLVDQRMMRWLLATEGNASFEVAGRWLLVAVRRVSPGEIVPLLATLKGFRDQLPRVVYDLYGPSATG